MVATMKFCLAREDGRRYPARPSMNPYHRTFVVTGASKGIGLAIVDALASRGARVFAGARDVSGLGPRQGTTFVSLDVTDESSVRAFAAVAIAADASVLVNNAGVGLFGGLESITVEDYRRVMDTNVLGTLLPSRELWSHFRARGDGRIINVTSDVSDRTFSGGALYTASKFAQRAMTRAMAYEGHAHGIRVTEIRPGLVDTAFGGSEANTERKRAWLRPTDVVDSVLHAVSAPAHVRIDEIVLHPHAQEVVF